jgi:3-hydroxybutyryl-CoA dehydrogenase
VQDELLVVGGGAMGTGIAIVAARGGYAVSVVETDPAARERGAARAEKDGVQLTWLEGFPAQSNARIAIEAVPERSDLKRDVLLRMAGSLDPDAILATNTSSLSVGDLADGLPNGDRLIGLHFFNPPTKMQLVELVERDANSDETIESARAFVEQIGKTLVLTADTPGLIVNRVARPFYLQSIRALDAGVASANELDALARAMGFRMGPFELMDMIGLDVNLATSESLYERLHAERFVPLETQRSLVAQGHLGRKSGAGFYDYADGDPERIDLRVAPLEPDETNIEEVVAVVGFGGNAEPMAEMLDAHFASVQRIEFDEAIDEIDSATTIVIDIGDGVADRGDLIVQLDAHLPAEAVIFVDAYATDLVATVKRMTHPERLVGYGILGAFESQSAVEIVDGEWVSDDALALAQEIFEMLGKGVMLAENVPGLFLGRVVGAIVNEAMIAVHDEVATPEDIDTAMQLGVNYPSGPITWGREIGGARIAKILQNVASRDGEAFAPHRSLWVLDVENNEEFAKDVGDEIRT